MARIVRRAPLMRGVLPLLVWSVSACGAPDPLPACIASRPDGGPTIDAGADPVLLAAGDIAGLEDTRSAEQTARLLDGMNGLVATLGDNVQGDGSLDEFMRDYDPTWGRHRWRTRPAVGNHEYRTPNAGPYFAYFCTAAGEPFRGYYAYDLGAWHVVVLNSECAEGDGPACDAASDQVRWLRADLAAHPAECTLAYWHNPRFSSAMDGDEPAMHDAWQSLYDAGAEVVLSAHWHNYERFAPQTADGVLDDARGMRQFVVGTGGAELEGFGDPRPNSEVRRSALGVLELTLRARAYDWRFVGVGGTVLDSGTAACH